MSDNSKHTRRSFLAHSGAATVAATVSSAAAAKTSDKPPNIVYIVCDQMRGDAMSCVGNPNANTPNLDRMAKEGVLFERWFSNNPVCSPSRVTAFSGLYPHQTSRYTNNSGMPLMTYKNTILGYFRERGYHLGWVGKNHTYYKLGLLGLDYCSERAREPFRGYNPYVPPWWHSDMYWPIEDLHATLNTEDSIEFLKSARKDQPFFLHISYFDPHPPYFAPAEYAGQKAGAAVKIPKYVDPAQLSDRLAKQQRAVHYDRITDADLKQTIKYYHASVEWGVDHQVGRILDTLRETQLEENTIVLFTSDHGDFIGDHGMMRKGMFLYDSLLHVPMIWYAPGRFKPGRRVNTVAQGVDLFPTLIDLTAGTVPGDLPGKSVKPWLIDDEPEDNDAMVFAAAKYSDLLEGYFDDPEPFCDPSRKKPFHTRVQKLTWAPEYKTAMVRTRDWKLIKNETQPTELYHLDGALGETKNIADNPQVQDVRKHLEEKLDEIWPW